jgi:poly-gamma-glutamate synthesis protein (capsule biosynthesis protein)
MVFVKFFLFLSLIFQGFFFQVNPQEISVMVVGDIMTHSPVVHSAYNPSNGQYNFESMFAEVKPIFAEADLVIGNLESPIAGDHLPFLGYPQFNAPVAIAPNLKNVGFDVLTTANNHAMDQYEAGLINTLNVLDRYGIYHTGSARSAEEQAQGLIVDVSGIRLGIIAYTFGTNSIPLPAGKPYSVNLLNIDLISKEVQTLKDRGADYIVAMIHYGVEYVRFPNAQQIEWTNQILDSGVDFVLGSHPHVVQPVEMKENGKVAIYSLGNFISNQTNEWKDYGVILDLRLTKDFKTGKTTLTKVEAIPTYVERTPGIGRSDYLIHPLIEGYDKVNRTIQQRGRELLQHLFSDEGKAIVEQAA